MLTKQNRKNRKREKELKRIKGKEKVGEKTQEETRKASGAA